MSVEIKIPRLAESISEAVLVEWLKGDGDHVKTDEPIATLETDKAAVEIAAEESGTLRHVRKAGDTVQVGDVIARIEAGTAPAKTSGQAEVEMKTEAGASAKGGRPATGAGAAGGTAERAQTVAPSKGAAPAPQAAPTNGAGDQPLSPAVRRLVDEHGLDPASIEASGKGGRLLKEDVLKHLESGGRAGPQGAGSGAGSTPAKPVTPSGGPARHFAAEPAPLPLGPGTDVTHAASGDIAWSERETERAVPMSRIRQRIATRLVQAQQTAAILTTFNEVDMGDVMALRARYKERFEKRHGVKLGFMSFFARACVLALEEIPEINAEIRGAEIIYKRHVHMGVAVGSDRGLVVPVVKHCEGLGFADIERELSRLAGKAREGTLSLDELSGGTFTISNGGVYGSLLSTPILNPPQSGILGMHKIEKRPIVNAQDEVVVRPMMYLALSYDHRIVDGEQAVTFLVRVKERLEDPERMLLDV